MIPLDQELRPTWLFGKTVHEGCDRGGYYEQGDFAHEYGSPKCLVRIGCWGPVVNCNVTKRGWMAGIGGCPNVGGICIGCTMPGFPDKFMPFMDEPPGGVLSSSMVSMYGKLIRKLRSFTNTTVNKEPKWRHRGPRAHHRLPSPRPTAPASRRRRPPWPPSPSRSEGPRAESANLVEMSWDPITRIVGSLGIYTKIDFANRQVAECHSTSSIFRGYSIFMKGKDPRDAHFITSRICGICGDNHATCACYAQNMAFGIRPPAMGEWIVNLGEAAEYMFDHNIFQDNLVGVDFCEQMVKETNPGVWDKAQRTAVAARRRSTTTRRSPTSCGRSTRSPGDFYREALQMSRMTREMFCLMEGRHVHPSTLYPGGVGTVPTQQLFTDYLVRLMKYVEFMKKVVPLHDDLFDFFYEALPGYEEVGRRRVLLGCWGSFNDPDVCDYTYENMDEWGRAMYVTPGVIVDGKAVTHDLVDINLNIRILLGSVVLRRLGERGAVRPERPAGQPGRPPSPVEPDDHAAAAEARLRGQLLLGHVAALAAPADPRAPGPRHRRRADRPALVDGAGGAGRHRLRQGDRPERQDLPAQDGDACPRSSSSGRSPSGATPSSATGPGPTSRPTPRRWPSTSPSRRWRSCTPAGPGPGPTSRCPTRPSAADSTRRCAACCRTTS